MAFRDRDVHAVDGTPLNRAARAPRRGPTLVIFGSRLVGVGPAVALIVLELALFALSGWLFTPSHITGSAGARGEDGRALTLPGPQVVVPRMTQAEDHPRQLPRRGSPDQFQTLDVASLFPLRTTAPPRRARQTPAASSALPAPTAATRATRGPAEGPSPASITAAVASQPGTRAKPIRHPGVGRRGSTTSTVRHGHEQLRRATTPSALSATGARGDTGERKMPRMPRRGARSRFAQHAGQAHPTRNLRVSPSADRRGRPLTAGPGPDDR